MTVVSGSQLVIRYEKLLVCSCELVDCVVMYVFLTSFVFFFLFVFFFCLFFFFQAEDGIRDLVRSRGLGDVYKRQDLFSIIVSIVLKRLSSLSAVYFFG